MRGRKRIHTYQRVVVSEEATGCVHYQHITYFSGYLTEEASFHHLIGCLLPYTSVDRCSSPISLRVILECQAERRIGR
jgi:hypothetical protein